MDDRVLNPDDALQRMEAWKGRIDKLAADTKAMSDRFQQLQVTKKDRDGLTEVTVDSTGALVELKLTREIERSSPDVVAATIMSTIRDAKAELAERSQEIIAETVGPESAAGQAIAAQVGDRLRSEGTADRLRDVEPDDDDELNIWR
jgi:DNA-binding protein YbaB